MQSNDRPSQGIPNLPYESMPPEPSGYSQASAPYMPQRPGKTNGFAIATLVLGLIGVCFLAIPFGIVALVQIKSTRQQGKGLAIAGLAASAVWLLGASAGSVASTIDADRSDLRGTAESVASTTVGDRGGPRATVGTTSIDKLSPGDCLMSTPADARVTHVTLVRCDEPHYAEVITEVRLSGPWPGTAQAFQQSEHLCMDATMAILANSTMLDQLRNLVLYPDQTRWTLKGTATCLVINGYGPHLTIAVPR
ncbi:DUF4190 domain-containing protein [Nocardia xishanensis]|uniref:DUF4190 domain-containing protein n=1 Tax=Nocardia xishanensis TaxID=238964 RepID=UPI0033C15B09